MDTKELTQKEKKRKENHDSWYWYKEHGICPCCRKENSAPGRTRCYKCIDILREGSHKNRKKPTREQLDDKKEKSKIAYQKLKENGICVNCRKRKALKGQVLCNECRMRRNKKSAEIRHKNGEIPISILFDGYRCCVCGSENTYKNFKLCKKHYEQKAAVMRKNRVNWTPDMRMEK